MDTVENSMKHEYLIFWYYSSLVHDYGMKILWLGKNITCNFIVNHVLALNCGKGFQVAPVYQAILQPQQ